MGAKKALRRAEGLTKEQAAKVAEKILTGTVTRLRETMEEVGRTLFLDVFGGDEAAYRSRSRHKAQSLRMIAAHDGMREAGWSATSLDRAVEIFLMSKVHDGFQAWPHLLTSHLVTVIGLAPEKQKKLLDQAEEERWTVARLELETGKRRPQPPPRTPEPLGAPGSASPQKVLGELDQARKTIEDWMDFSSGLATRLIEAGIVPDDTAAMGMMLFDLYNALGTFQEKLEQKRSPRSLAKATGKILAMGKGRTPSAKATGLKRAKGRG
ncbi:MAG: hypothetical protein HY901_04865 [Deltaproteobacteria bacterium]|nr:hypothetical protein [Deltaproteobacteria bacterium]